VRVGNKRRHGPGIIILALIPLTAFALGSWQVQRLGWKTDLIAKFEDRLTRPPLPLPPYIDPTAIGEFDYRRVIAVGRFRHDEEMLVGPRLMEGEDGYNVITPLERANGSTILVSRGWIAKKFREQKAREQSGEALPKGEVTVEGLLREPFKKNMFTPDNNLVKREFYFPDIPQMASLVDAQPVWVEETMESELMETLRRQDKGIPVGRTPEVSLKNNHAQYIFTW
jgi:surfeit locus 1 family protein